jgi:hypothetical protein
VQGMYVEQLAAVEYFPSRHISSSYLRYGRCDLVDIITFLYLSMCYNCFDLSACHIT